MCLGGVVVSAEGRPMGESICGKPKDEKGTSGVKLCTNA